MWAGSADLAANIFVINHDRSSRLIGQGYKHRYLQSRVRGVGTKTPAICGEFKCGLTHRYKDMTLPTYYRVSRFNKALGIRRGGPIAWLLGLKHDMMGFMAVMDDGCMLVELA